MASTLHPPKNASPVAKQIIYLSVLDAKRPGFVILTALKRKLVTNIVVEQRNILVIFWVRSKQSSHS